MTPKTTREQQQPRRQQQLQPPQTERNDKTSGAVNCSFYSSTSTIIKMDEATNSMCFPVNELDATRTKRRRRRRRPQRLLGHLFASLAILLQLVGSIDGHQTRRSTPDDSALPVKGAGSCQAQTVGHRLISQQQQQQANQNTNLADYATKKVFCFYDIQDDFRPQDLNSCLCTHVVYSYVAVRKNLSFIAGKKGDLRSLASLKRRNPNLKLLVSLRPDDYFSFDATGAQAGQQPQPQQWTETAASPNSTTTTSSSNEMHQKFAKRIRDFIVRHSLDGINLDWPYFAQTIPTVNGSREHLSLVLQAINENFQSTLGQSSPSSSYLRSQSPLVTLTVSKDFYSLVDGYDFHATSRLFDFVHLPAFDFDLNVDQYSIGHPARLHGISDAENLDTLVDLLLSSGLPSEQLIAGIPSHGVQITSRQQQVANNQQQPVGAAAAATNLDEQLEAAANISIVSHSEVCRVRQLAKANCWQPGQAKSAGQQAATGQSESSCWTLSRSRDLTAPFAYDSEHWIGFDDETSVKLKAKYVLLRHLAGVALFTVNNDDPLGSCGFGSFPLLATVNAIFARAPVVVSSAARQQPQVDGMQTSSTNQRTYFTRAPNQILTATSLVSQIFGKKLANGPSRQSAATTPASGNGDLMQSASDEIPSNHQTSNDSPNSNANNNQQQQQSLMSFVDIIEKYGSVNRVDATAAGNSGDNLDPDAIDRQLPCEKVGYLRYPRDCSRFYRCVQTPPVQAATNVNTSQHTTTTSSPALEQTTTTTPAVTTTAVPNKQIAVTSVTRLQYECPSGLVFDEQYQICNWPSWSAQCTGSGEVNSITNSKFICPNYGYFQNQENCEYFYYCSDYNRGRSQAYQFRCPFELGFDEEKLQCNWKWLVKGCNATSPVSTSTEQPGSSTEMAQKYLAALEKQNAASNNNNNSNTQTEIQLEKAADSVELKKQADSSAQIEVNQTAPTLSKRSLIDFEEPTERAEARAFTPAILSHMTSLLASVEAIRDHRMKKAGQVQAASSKPSSSSPTSTSSPSEKETKQTKYPSYVGTQPTTSPPKQQQPSSLSTLSTFRTRRKPSTAAPDMSPSGSETVVTSTKDKQPAGISPPYRRRPAPPSIFPFLPTNAVYMVVDSLRSVGEALQDELNRYMRLAGDRVRDMFGQRPARRVHYHTSAGAVKRQSDDNLASLYEHEKLKLAQLASRFGGSTGATWQVKHSSTGSLDAIDDGSSRRKRTKRDTSGDNQYVQGDLQALESGASGGGTWVLAPHPQQHQPAQVLQVQASRPQHVVYQQQYKSPLGLPAGYPLNPLDEAAKAAVLGPEPKNFHQPGALVLNEMTGISQQEYERLVKMNINKQPGPNAYQRHSIQYNPMGAHVDPMLMAASEHQQSPLDTFDQSKVIDRIIEQSRVAFSLSPAGNHQQEQQQHVPFGMPTVVRPVNGELLKAQESKIDESKSRKRSTVAMKLATLAMPKFSLLPTTTTTPASAMTTTATDKQSSASSKGYMSFLPSLSNVMVGPARNLAKGINKAVQELISTLAPGGSSASNKNNQQQMSHSRPMLPITTPMPIPLQQHQHQQNQQQQQQQNFHHQQQMMRQQQQHQENNQHPSGNNHHNLHESLQMNTNRTNNPLLLTEDEARALSHQLDQLSKEQLEALSQEFLKEEHNKQTRPAGQQPNQQAATQPITESPDYVVRLLKLLSQTSHNPEDIKLLDQLASQLNNPQIGGPNNGHSQQHSTGDQSLIEAGQPDDLALLEALGLISAKPQQAAPSGGPQEEYSVIAADGEAGDSAPPQMHPPSDQQQSESYENYQSSKRPHHMRGRMKPLKQRFQNHMQQQNRHQQNSHHQEQRPKLMHYENLPNMQIESDSGTTKFVPVALHFQEEVTSPAPKYNSYDNYYYTTTTTTTTTTQRPTQIVTEVVEQRVVEQPPPPVRQTYTELIENNVTTPDGIETSIETRTKTAISGGANYNIGSQVGLGMIPQAFGGSVPSDSPQSMAQFSATSNETPTIPSPTTETKPAASSSAQSNQTSTSVSSSSPQVIAQNDKQTTTSTIVGGVKGGTSKFQSSSGFNQANSGLTAEQLVQLNANRQQQQQFGSNSQFSDQQQFGPADSLNQQQFSSTGAFREGPQNGVSSQTSGTSSTSLQFANGQSSQPVGSSQFSRNSFSSPNSGAFSSSNSLSGYNFATQPVNQFEEVVIKKKFKPFPKTVAVPQSYQMEEVMQQFSPPPVVQSSQQTFELTDNSNVANVGQQQQQQQQQQVSFSQSAEEQRQQQQQQIQQESISSNAEFGGGSSSSGASASSGGSTLDNQQKPSTGEKIKDEEFSTIASTFGEVDSQQQQQQQQSSLTKQELQNSQQLEQQMQMQFQLQQQQESQDLQKIQQQLQQLEQQQRSPFGQAMPLTAGEGTIGEVVNVGLSDALGGSSGSSDGSMSTDVGGDDDRRQQQFVTSSKTSKKSSGSKKRQRIKASKTSPRESTRSDTTSTTTTTTTTTSAPKLAEEPASTRPPRSVDSSEAPTEAPAKASASDPSRVEAAFSNFMVELKRSRQPAGSTTAAPAKKDEADSTTTTSSTDGDKQKKPRKSRSKKTGPSSRPTESNKPEAEEAAETTSESRKSSSRRKKTSAASRSSSERSQPRRKSSKSGQERRRRPNQDESDQLAASASSQRVSDEPLMQRNKAHRPASNRVQVQQQTRPLVEREQVAVYGTKSGFIPIIRPDDPSYSMITTGELSRETSAPSVMDPLSVSASISSLSRHHNQAQFDERAASHQRPSRPAQETRAKDLSWRNFVRQLQNQISVVHLGNYSEQVSNHSSKLIQVKLVILPASPNNQLLNPLNWRHLSRNYPQLFAADLSDYLSVGTIELGQMSILLQNGGLIDEHLESQRYLEFRRQFQQISELVEEKTFKALDEIVQRSSGQLFMLQRKGSLDRTMVAVIPDRPFIRSAQSGVGYQRLVTTRSPSLISQQATTTTTGLPSTSTSGDHTGDSLALLRHQTPQKAATFSRAIQESIQEAIRAHYDSMKSQLRQSLSTNSEHPSEENLSTVASSTTESDESYNSKRQWSTPASETLAHMESETQSQSLSTADGGLEAAASSTQYSIVEPSAEATTTTTTTSEPTPPSYQAQSIYEVEGAEPKALYGLELNQSERQRYSTTTAVPEATNGGQSTPKPPGTTTRTTRFISIGSHLMSSPMKKIVDQAYVNHFYDHIGDHQLARSVGLGHDQPASGPSNSTSAEQADQVRAELAEAPTDDDQQQATSQTINVNGEDSLVPESACTRAGLFQHPFACNKFYECFWDKQLNKYTLHMFECPIKLAFDDRIVGCAMPIESSLCVNY